jgi:hypothetical protein
MRGPLRCRSCAADQNGISPGASLELEYGRHVGAAIDEAVVREIPKGLHVIRITCAILPPLGVFRRSPSVAISG